MVLQMKRSICAVMTVACLSCLAGNGTWNGAGTNLDWWDPQNWQGGTVGGGAGAAVSIAPPTDTSIYLTNSVSLRNLGVSGSTVTLAGTGNLALADSADGNGTMYFNVISKLLVDVPVLNCVGISKANTGELFLNDRLAVEGRVNIDGGSFASDWNRVADRASPVSGAANVTEDVLSMSEMKVNDATVLFNSRVSRNSDQSFAASLSTDTPYVTLASTSSLSAGQLVEAPDGLLASGTFIRRVVNGTTVELSAKPTGTANATITVRAAPMSCSRQNVPVLSVGKSLDLWLNTAFQLSADKLAGDGANVAINSNGRLIAGDTRGFCGTVTLGRDANLSLTNALPLSGDLPVTDSLLFRMDASDAATLTLNGDSVTAWRTVGGAGDITATPAGSTRPVLLRNALNGRAVVDMGPAVDDGGMAWSAPIGGIRTFFVVVGSQNGGGTLLGANGTLDGYCFARGCDPFASKGIRNNLVYTLPITRDHVLFRHDASQKPERTDLQYWVNGSAANFTTPLSGEYDIVGGILNEKAAAASAFARVADGVHDRTGSEGGQRLAEVILYSRVLTADERQSVEAYLRRKWFGETPRGWGCGYVEHVVDNTAHNTGSTPVTGWPNGGRIRIGTFEQSAACEYFTVNAGSTLEMDRAVFAKKLRLMNGGSVEFTARQTSATCPVPGAALHVDANLNVETDGSGNVVHWGGVDGAGYACTNRNGAGAAPTLVANGLNGMPVIDFGAASSGQHLVWHTNIMVRALFYVMKAENKFVSFCGSVCPEMEVVDHFTRYNNQDGYIYDPSVQTGARGGIVRLDGHRILNPHQYTLSTSSFKLLGHTLDCPAMANAFGCGALEKGNLRATRTGGLQLAEVLIYDRKLTDDESLAVQAYLRYKWFGETLPGFSAPGEPFALPGLGAGGSGTPTVTIHGAAPVSIGQMFGGETITLSAPDGAVVAVPAVSAPLALSNVCLSASADIGRGVYINNGSTNSLVSSGGKFAAALVYGTLKIRGDAAVNMGTLYLFDGGSLLLAPDSDECQGIAADTVDAQGAGTVHLEIPSAHQDQPQGRYTVISAGGYSSDESRAFMRNWSVTSNLDPEKWNVKLNVSGNGVSVCVAPKGLTILIR